VELESVGPERTGVAVGLVFAVVEVGGFLGPFAIGASADLTGSYAAGLGLPALGTVVAFGASLVLEVRVASAVGVE
jgi:nitrate/nitrite transporter NarK